MTDRPYLLLKPEVSAAPAGGRPGHVALHVDGEPCGVVLGEAAWYLAENFDGTRTAEAIFTSLRAEGVPAPDPDFVRSFAEALGQQGLVELLPEPAERPHRRYPPTEVEMIDPLRGECFGCGRSCYGHVIAPLDTPFIERIEGLHQQMTGTWPDLEGQRPLRKVQTPEGRKLLALNQVEGRCLYLDTSDGLCRIHKAHGAAAKPIVCRLFPLSLVQTEEGVRIGTPLNCYLAHKSFDQDEGLTPEALTGVSPDDYPPPLERGVGEEHALVLNPEPGTSHAHTNEVEETVLRLLSHPDTDLAALLMATAELTTGRAPAAPGPEGLLGDSAFGVALVERLNQFARDAREVPENRYGEAAPGSHHAEVAALLDFLSGLKPRPFSGLGEATRRFTLYVLRQELFLRTWARHPALLPGLLIAAVGPIVAAWRAEDAGEGGESEIGDTFAFTLTAWFRALRMPPNVERLLPSQEAFLSLIHCLAPPE